MESRETLDAWDQTAACCTVGNGSGAITFCGISHLLNPGSALRHRDV